MTAQILEFKPREDGRVTTKAIKKVEQITESGVFQAIRRRQELDKKEEMFAQELVNWYEMFGSEFPYHK